MPQGVGRDSADVFQGSLLLQIELLVSEAHASRMFAGDRRKGMANAFDLSCESKPECVVVAAGPSIGSIQE